MNTNTATKHTTTGKTPARTLDERRAWREIQWARRNRSAAWLIEQAVREAETTRSFVKPPRPARCGWPIGRVTIQLIHGKASVRNLEHCASPWCCPICSTIIRAQRARDLQKAANRWTGQGHALLFVTLTRPHTKTEPLATGMDIIGHSWSDMAASTRWRAIKRAYGIRHWVRSIEITRSPSSGWHVHIHALIFIDQSQSDDKQLQADLLNLWNKTLERHGSRPASKRRGVIVLPVRETPGNAGRYLSKPPDRIGSEITRMDTKTGREQSLAPFQLLDPGTIDRLGEEHAKHLWLEYINATTGQRSITWSRRLRAELIGGPKQTDQQIIDDTLRGIPVLDIPSDAYRQLKREPSVLGFLLSRVETGEIPLVENIINRTDQRSK